MAIISLNDYSLVSASSAGTKAKKLALLKAKGFEVADGFVMTDVLSLFNFTKAQIDEFVSNLSLLETIKKDDIETMKEISKKITGIFENVNIKGTSQDELFKYYEDIFIDRQIDGVSDQIKDLISTGRDKSVIVRPTVFYKNNEENSKYSFSIFSSKDKIWKSQLLDAIKQVMVSYFSPYALFYYQTHSIIAKEINFSVLVQQHLLVSSRGSFSLKNPDMEEEKIILETKIQDDSLNIKHIPVDSFSDVENSLSPDEKSIILISTKVCSAVQSHDIIVDWIISKEKVHISNIRKLTFSDDETINRQIDAMANCSRNFTEGNILACKKFGTDMLFLYPKAQAIILQNEGLLSYAGELAREMKKRFIGRMGCLSNKIEADEIDGKKLLIENSKITIEQENSIEENFFNMKSIASDHETQENFFSKVLIKIPFNLDSNAVECLNERADRYENMFLIEKIAADGNSQHNYSFNYKDYYSNTQGDNENGHDAIRDLRIKELFVYKDNDATKINQMLGENLQINHYAQFNGLKELILFDFTNEITPQYIFINTKAVLDELANENLSGQNVIKIANLFKKFTIKAKAANKKLIIGLVLTEEGKCILKETLFYADYLLVNHENLDEFEKIQNIIKKYEQRFVFEYIKKQCMGREANTDPK
ncbi:MAG: hypothetical protein DRN66_00370 [Candidatus Nanohalarchaeota archaeon]|nr:MAG: hypothetical protein DRN66_00370 [Candidatus Nanohaloarchaeota archaeon]